MFTLVAHSQSRHHQIHREILARGLRAHGLDVILSDYDGRLRADTQHVACWGWRLGGALRARGHSVLVMELGYLGDRLAWTSLAWNGLNNRGAVPAPVDDGGARFARHFGHMLKPENPDGGYALIIGQVPGDASLRGRDLRPWYAEQAARHGQHMPVYFRPHPEAIKLGHGFDVPGAPIMDGPLADALAGARVVVTYNSNTGVDAVLAGKRATAADKGSMIWDYTDRETLLSRLAWRQWTRQEIESGEALAHVGLTDFGLPTLQ